MTTVTYQEIRDVITEAESLIHADRGEQAHAMLETAIQQHPNNADLHRLFGVAQEKQGDFEGEAKSYKTAIDLDPEQPSWVYIVLGRLLQEQGEIEAATQVFEKAVERFSDSDELFRLLETAVQQHPNDADLHRLLGIAQEKQGDLKGEVKSYQTAIDLNPDQPNWVYLVLGQLLQEQGNVEAAEQICQQAIERFPDSDEAFRLLGLCQEALGHEEEQLQNYQQAIALNPQQPHWVYLVVGLILRERDSHQESIHYYTCGLLEYPRTAELYQGLLYSYIKADAVQATIEEFQAAISSDSELPLWKYVTLALLLRQQHRFDESLSIYKLTVEKFADSLNLINPEGQEKLQSIEIASAQQTLEQKVVTYQQLILPAASLIENIITANIRDAEQATQDLDIKLDWPYVDSPQQFYPATLPDGSPWPKISIVTPSYNQGEFLEETILSVIHQHYPNVEHILMDGGSNDETTNIIEKYRDHFSYAVSEPDEGQSAALNKGFRHATGDILTWLNSDDRLAPGALYAAALAFYSNPVQVVAGICQLFKDGKHIGNHLASCSDGTLDLEEILDVEAQWLSGRFFYQPEVMFTKEIWHKSGGSVREDLYYSMDYELWARFAAVGASIKVIGHPIAQYRMHEAQKTSTTDRYKPELLQTRDFLREQFSSKASLIRGSSYLKPKKHSLRVVFFNDVGDQGGAGIAHHRIAQVFAAAGNDVTFLAATLDWSLTPADCSPDEIYGQIQSYAPDLVVVGNLHNTQDPIGILERLCASPLSVLFVMHDQWLLTGRCAYTGNCDRYTKLCNEDCPTSHEYPKLAPEKIPDAFRRKLALLSEDNFSVVSDSQWLARWSCRAALNHTPNSLKSQIQQKFSHIYYGLDAELFQPLDRAFYREKLGLPLDKFIIITGSQSLQDERKGARYILDALSLLEIDDILLVCFGNGTALSDKLDVHFTGFIDEPAVLSWYYGCADLFVGPSREEAFGQTFIEAAACGTPAIGFDVGGVPEAIADGISGRIVPQMSAESLAGVISELYENPEQLEQLKRTAPIYVRSQFSLQRSYYTFVKALEKKGWLERLNLQAVSKLSPQTTSPEVIPIRSSLFQQNNAQIIGTDCDTVQGFTISGFDHLEQPRPHLNLLSCSRWLLWPGGRFVLSSPHRPRTGQLTILCRNVVPEQSVKVLRDGDVFLQSPLTKTDISAENMISVPVELEEGFNFFEISTRHFYQGTSGDKKLCLLIEDIYFHESTISSDDWIGRLSRSLTITMNEHLEGQGWFSQEQVNGKPVRWMGQEGTVKARGGLLNHALKIEILGIAAVSREILSSLEVFVNRDKIKGDLYISEQGRWKYEGLVHLEHESIKGSEQLIVEMKVREAVQLSQDDQRIASLLVQEVSLVSQS